jgi:hypothetical protein
MLVLNDLDIFRYRCGYAAEKNHYLVELTNPDGHKEWKEFSTKKEAADYGARVVAGVSASFITWTRKDVQPLENALQIVKQSLSQTYQAIEDKVGEKLTIRAFLSGKTNFRQSIAVTRPYKGNREENTKPTYYDAIGEYLLSNWEAVTTADYEADDAIGIEAMAARERGESVVVVSNDKDLDQIPGWHYNWVTKEFYEVSPKEAKTNLFTQILTGDSTDNVPGLPGVGPATAAKILKECSTPIEMVDACYQAYRDYFVNKDKHLLTQQIRPYDDWASEYMFEQAQLVYILKRPNEFWDLTKEGTYFIEKYHNGLYKEKEQEQIPAATQRT